MRVRCQNLNSNFPHPKRLSRFDLPSRGRLKSADDRKSIPSIIAVARFEIWIWVTNPHLPLERRSKLAHARLGWVVAMLKTVSHPLRLSLSHQRQSRTAASEFASLDSRWCGNDNRCRIFALMLSTLMVFLTLPASATDLHLERREAIDQLLQDFPRGSNDPASCLRSYQKTKHLRPAFGYVLQQNWSYGNRYELLGTKFAARLFDQKKEEFTIQSCTTYYSRHRDSSGRNRPMVVSGNQLKHSEHWLKLAGGSCFNWVMNPAGQAIRYKKFDVGTGRFPNGTCNCVIGECTYLEILPNASKKHILVNGKFENGVYFSKKYFRKNGDVTWPTDPDITSKESFKANGDRIASYIVENEREYGTNWYSYSVHFDDDGSRYFFFPEEDFP